MNVEPAPMKSSAPKSWAGGRAGARSRRAVRAPSITVAPTSSKNATMGPHRAFDSRPIHEGSAAGDDSVASLTPRGAYSGPAETLRAILPQEERPAASPLATATRSRSSSNSR